CARVVGRRRRVRPRHELRQTGGFRRGDLSKSDGEVGTRLMRRMCAIVALVAGLCEGLTAQGPPGPPVAAPPKIGREGALVDFTCIWVSACMEVYRWRMVSSI